MHGLPVHSWLGRGRSERTFDQAMVGLCDGPTIDLGCGPGADLRVADDTLSTLEQEFWRSMAPKSQVMQTVLIDYALELKGTVAKDYTVPPAWSSELMRRLSVAGVRRRILLVGEQDSPASHAFGSASAHGCVQIVWVSVPVQRLLLQA